MPKQSSQATLIEDQPEPAVQAMVPSSSQPPASADVALTFERLAKDPSVDVEKLEKLIEMQERILAYNARAEYNAAFAQMQGELPVISEKGSIIVDGVERSKYARYEDIIEVVRPILKKYGFAIRHRNVTTPDGKLLKIVGVLSHRGGHAEEDEFDCPPDISGKKNSIQAMGSTRSYGQRYTTIALLNIVSRGQDDDGHGAGSADRKEEAVPPAGYADWFDDLTATADEGMPKLTSAWNRSKQEYRKYLSAHNAAGWEALKRRAANIGGGR